MRGHVELDGKPYNVTGYRKALADQMAIKTGRGSNTYADQQNWDYFVQEDWTAGLGKIKAQDMGAPFLLGDMRRSGRLGLLPYPVPIDSHAHDTYAYEREPMTGSITVGDTGTYKYLSIRPGPGFVKASDRYLVVRMLVKTPAASTPYGLRFFNQTSASNAAPNGSALKSNATAGTLYASMLPGFHWHEYVWDLSSASATYDVLRIECSTHMEIAVGSSAAGATTNWALSDSAGTSWSAPGNTPLVYAVGYPTDATYSGFFTGMYELGLPVFTKVAAGSTSPFMLFDDDLITGSTSYGTTVENVVLASGAYVASPSDAVSTETGMYYGVSGNANLFLHYYSLEDGSNTSLGVIARHVDIGGGFLWRTFAASNGSKVEDIYYTADESTWSQVNVKGQNIRDIQFWGEFLWFITDTGLWYVGYGDAPLRVMETYFSPNAKLFEWSSRLYIIDGSDMLEFDGGSVRNVSPMNNPKLPGIIKGTITAVTSTNAYFYIGITASADDGRSGVYVWNGSGWGCCFLFGSNVEVVDILAEKGSEYDGLNDFRTMHIVTETGYFKWAFYDSGTVPEPTEDAGAAGIYVGYQSMWLETPWLYGGIVTLDKDWESVSVVMERSIATSDATAATSCEYDLDIYYKEDESDAWTLLDSSSHQDEDHVTEARFPLASRPRGKKLRVAVLLTPKDQQTTAQFAANLTGLIIKYHAMLRDRWSWQLSIPVGDKLQLADGSTDYRSFEEMVTDIEESMVRETGPFIMRDINGKEYEVKVNSTAFDPTDMKWDRGRKRPKYTGVYSVSLEQTTTTEYTG